MRVLVLSHLYPRPNDLGQAVFIRRQIQELARLGVEFRIVSPVPWAPPLPAWSRRAGRTMAASRATPSSWELDGIRIDAPRYLKLPGALDFGLFGPLYYRGVRKLVHAIHREWPFDVIHGQMLVPDGYAAARLGLELGVPSVATERGYLPTQLRGSRGLRASVKWTIENATQTVFVAQALADLACGFAKPRRPARVVYTGLDQERFKPSDRAAARKKLGLPADRPILLFVGHNARKKGLYVLFEALPEVWRRHPDALLCVIGKDSASPEVQSAAHGLQSSNLPCSAKPGFATQGEAEHPPPSTLHPPLLCEARLRYAGRSREPSTHILLLGPRSNEELPIWYAASDIVVLPSFREGLPNNLVEAAACARPIVATVTDGIPEVVRDGETGLLVQKGDVGGLAAALGRMLGDPGLAGRMGERGREFAAQLFSWVRHGRGMMEVYSKTTARQHQVAL